MGAKGMVFLSMGALTDAIKLVMASTCLGLVELVSSIVKGLLILYVSTCRILDN